MASGENSYYFHSIKLGNGGWGIGNWKLGIGNYELRIIGWGDVCLNLLRN